MLAQIVKHQLRQTEHDNFACLLPFGHYLNAKILDMTTQDDAIVFDKGQTAQYIQHAIIPYPSDVMDCLSLAIYGLSGERIFRQMMLTQEGEMHEDRVLFLVVRTKKEKI